MSSNMTSHNVTCHSRWCPLVSMIKYNPPHNINFLYVDPPASSPTPFYYPGCTSANGTNATSIRINSIQTACCNLYCGQRSQLLQLECQGISQLMAIVTWIAVLALMFSATLLLVTVLIGKGLGRKVAVPGGALFLSFTSLVASEFGGNMDLLSTPLYPVVGATNVAAFSYLFAGYQYSIGLGYEISTATALVSTMFPIWLLLTTDLHKLINTVGMASAAGASGVPNPVQRDSATAAGSLAIAMLCVSTSWVVYSSVFRTVGYMAAYIGAYKKQKEGKGPKVENFMSSLWVLAAADGHPTWRTREGQSMGLYLAALSWCVVVESKKYLDSTCKDDLILFHIMMWFPPVMLTLVVLITRFTMFVKETRCSTQYNFFQGQKWTEIVSKKKWTEKQHLYTEAVIIYRLGKKSMDVWVDYEYHHLRWGRIHVDRVLATMVLSIETFFTIITFPGYLVIMIIHGLRKAIWQPRKCFLHYELSMKKEAFVILYDYCGVKSEIVKKLNEVNEGDIRKEVRRLLGQHLDKIDLPLLLDNIQSNCLLYLLEELVEVTSVVDPTHDITWKKCNYCDSPPRGTPHGMYTNGRLPGVPQGVTPKLGCSPNYIDPTSPALNYMEGGQGNLHVMNSGSTEAIHTPNHKFVPIVSAIPSHKSMPLCTVVQKIGEDDTSIITSPLAREQSNVPTLRKRVSKKEGLKVPKESNKMENEVSGASNLFLEKYKSTTLLLQQIDGIHIAKEIEKVAKSPLATTSNRTSYMSLEIENKSDAIDLNIGTLSNVDETLSASVDTRQKGP